MTATTKKTLVIAAIIAAILLFFYKKKSKGTSAVVGAGSPPDGYQPELFLIQNFSWENEYFEFSTPLGNYTISDPNTSSTAYQPLAADGNYQFGWQAPTQNIVVATLLPLKPNAVVTNVVLDLTTKTVKFEYNQL
jgi:hypothetical protein